MIETVKLRGSIAETEPLINRLVKLAKDFTEINAECGLCGVDGRIHLNDNEYKVLFPDYKDHDFSKHGGYIKVSHITDGVEFFCLVEPNVKGDLRGMVG